MGGASGSFGFNSMIDSHHAPPTDPTIMMLMDSNWRLGSMRREQEKHREKEGFARFSHRKKPEVNLNLWGGLLKAKNMSYILKADTSLTVIYWTKWWCWQFRLQKKADWSQEYSQSGTQRHHDCGCGRGRREMVVDIPERKARTDSIFSRIFILKVSEIVWKEWRQMHSIHSADVQRITLNSAPQT